MFKTLLTKLKIFIRLNYTYPRSERFKKVRSILPASVNVGKGVVIEHNVIFSDNPLRIGDYTYIGDTTYIQSCAIIGNFCSISRNVHVGLTSHPKDFISTSPIFYAARRGWVSQNKFDEKPKGNCEIGHDVLISAGAMILAGIKIGNGSIIGAGAFVNEDVPPYAIVAGIPSRIIGYRFGRDIIEELEKLKWWNMEQKELMKLERDFNNVPEFVKKISYSRK